MSSIKLSSQIDFSKIQYQSPTLNSYGGKMAKVTYDEKWALIQTPSLKCPFGLNIYDDADSKTYSFDVSINKNIPKEDEFLNFLKTLEDQLITHVSENSQEWIDSDEGSKDVCKALLRSSLKYSRDKQTKKFSDKYPPRIKVSVPFYENEMKFKAYQTNNGEMKEIKTMEELEQLMKNSIVTLILRYDRITFNGGKYGFKFTLQQLRINSTGKTNMFNEPAFIEDNE